MSTKLEKLIAAYEAESASLTAELEECVAEMDYGRAHLFSKALRHVNQQLQTLCNLQDKWHDEKDFLAHSIRFWEERASAEEEYLGRYPTERIAEEKKKLAELQQASAQKTQPGHCVRTVLSSLLAGEITGCTLVFHDSNRLICTIRLARKTLILTVPEVRRHQDSYTLKKRHIKCFKRLGFRLFDDKDKLMLFVPYTSPEDVRAVQGILARITFDILNFKEFTGESYIKYYP